MNVVGVIQARMGSSRLPGKVMLPLAGVPVIEHGVRTARGASSLDSIVVATTGTAPDDVVAGHARRLGVDIHRGAERDVLGRIRAASRGHDADVIVRLLGDHPLVDSSMIDVAVERLADSGVDLVTTRLDRTLPRGTAVEAITAGTLAELDGLTDDPDARETISGLYRAERDRFAVGHLRADAVLDDGFLADFDDLTRFRVVLDEPADYERLWRIYEDVDFDDRLPLTDAIRYLHATDVTGLDGRPDGST